MSSLIVKNFSGSFNSENIGHEIINNFAPDNSDYYYFYIPPYGCVGTEDKDKLYKNKVYKSIDKIFVFDTTNVTNILKLKMVIIDPIPFDSFEEMKKEAERITYGGKHLNEINFGDEDFSVDKNTILDVENDGMPVFLLSYKVDKKKIYDFESDNIFIWHSSTKKRNGKKGKSIETIESIYKNKNYTIKEFEIPSADSSDDLSIGQKQYVYKKINAFDNWFDESLKAELKEDKIAKLEVVNSKSNNSDVIKEDNFLKFVMKNNDENYYTNYISAILNSNETIKKLFFKELVEKFFSINNYEPRNVVVKKQFCTLTKAFKTTKGIMDLYLFDDNYRIVIENKILSNINGKKEDDKNQIDTYKQYLDGLNKYQIDKKEKENKVIILCPDMVKGKFNYITYEYTYGELYEFYNKNSKYIVEKYREDFLNTIKMQSYSKESLIAYRFKDAIRNK